jgi:ferredoxin
VIDKTGLSDLFTEIRSAYQLIGPTVHDGVIRYAPIENLADLPIGWTDEHAGGKYRLEPRDDESLFGYVNGPDSAKNSLFPPSAETWSYRDGEFTVTGDDSPPIAIIGLRACDLAAISIQDEVLLNGPFADTHYEGRRQDFFIVAVNCTTYGANCFCTSMGTGPKVTSLFDLALTEVIDDDGHRFVVDVGSEQGAELLHRLDPPDADQADIDRAAELVDAVASSISKRMDTTDISAFLSDQAQSPRWQAIADRCLSCTNCTAVCPTCFCTSPVDTTDFDGTSSRSRVWDSCFSLDYSFMGEGPVRESGSSRYRQWMTHKLGTWIEQFGTSGCVGCGRCITWCPVGIDITEEMAMMREGA